ncbi:unnamed protein product, partial [Rotaria sordida]
NRILFNIDQFSSNLIRIHQYSNVNRRFVFHHDSNDESYESYESDANESDDDDSYYDIEQQIFEYLELRQYIDVLPHDLENNELEDDSNDNDEHH